MRLTRACWIAIILACAFGVACGGGGGDKKKGGGGGGGTNQPPVIARPTGPGTVGGTSPSFSTVVSLNDNLGFGISVNDPQVADTVTFTAAATGGSLTPSQAGFSTPFPASTVGLSPRLLLFQGTALTAGDVEITFTAMDQKNNTSQVTFTITISATNSPPLIASPVSPTWPVNGADPTYTGTVGVGSPLDFTIGATDPDGVDMVSFTAIRTGGSLDPAQAGFTQTFPVSNVGPSPVILSLTGTAALDGSIEITLTADDGRGGTDVVTLTLTLSSSNLAPSVGAPTGPGIRAGADPAYTAFVDVGGSLAFSVTAVDPNATDNITFRATVSGGTLTPAAAGLQQTFPFEVQGQSPQVLSFTGTGLQTGNIVLTFNANDGMGGLDVITLDITIENLPELGAPTGPGVVSGADPSYSATVVVGDSLNFTVTATDADGGDTLTLDATHAGGSLTALQAGFSQSLPQQATGFSPQMIGMGGTAANPGNLTIQFDVDDGIGGTDQITLAITILPANPVVTGFALYRDVNKNASLDGGDTVTITFNMGVALSGAAASDFDLPVTGDRFGGSASVASGALAREVVVTVGGGAVLRSQGDFDPGSTTSGSSSGVDVSGTMTPGAITALSSGVDAIPSVPVDVIPAYISDWAGVGFLPSSVALGDLDGDMDLDLVVAERGADETVWFNNGSGSFTDSGQRLGNSWNSLHVVLGDIDGDSDLDIVTAGFGQGNRVYTNDGSGNFTALGGGLGSGATTRLALANVDGDSDLDLIEANGNGEPNRVWFNNGSGTFTDSGQLLGAWESIGLAVGDIDGDNDVDLVFGNQSTAQEPNRVYKNNGSGQFTDTGQALGNSDTRAVALADLDGDLDLDLVAANGNFSNQPNRVWFNDGNGIFTDSGQSLGSRQTHAVALVDYDEDGDIDAIFGNINTRPDEVWLNDGNGVLVDSGMRLGLANTESIAVGDIDGDTDVDFMVSEATLFRAYLNSLAGTR